MVTGGGSVRVEIPGYEQFELLGTGGFSRVWKAYQPRFRRSVAVKILNFDIVDERAIRSFERECQAMGQVSSHPNIVTVLDNGLTEDDRPFIVMEYFEGGTYSDKLTRGPIPIEELLRVGVKISGALQTAHDSGVLHRDLKPHNIFVSKFDEPALGDFGISTIDQEKTSTGFAGYTVHYAPPEVLNGEKTTVQSDLYSLGATFYRLIRGVRPFDGADQSMIATAVRIVTEDAPTVARQDCPDRLVDLVSSLMSKDPADRPQSAAQVASEFQRIQADAGFAVSRLVVASRDETPPIAAALSPEEAPTIFRSIISRNDDAGSAGRSVPEVPPVPAAFAAAQSNTDLIEPAIETERPDPTVPGVDAGSDLDETIARDSLDRRETEHVTQADAVDDKSPSDDIDATIARPSLIGLTAASAQIPRAEVVETEPSDIEDSGSEDAQTTPTQSPQDAPVTPEANDAAHDASPRLHADGDAGSASALAEDILGILRPAAIAQDSLDTGNRRAADHPTQADAVDNESPSDDPDATIAQASLIGLTVASSQIPRGEEVETDASDVEDSASEDAQTTPTRSPQEVPVPPEANDAAHDSSSLSDHDPATNPRNEPSTLAPGMPSPPVDSDDDDFDTGTSDTEEAPGAHDEDSPTGAGIASAAAAAALASRVAEDFGEIPNEEHPPAVEESEPLPISHGGSDSTSVQEETTAAVAATEVSDVDSQNGPGQSRRWSYASAIAIIIVLLGIGFLVVTSSTSARPDAQDQSPTPTAAQTPQTTIAKTIVAPAAAAPTEPPSAPVFVQIRFVGMSTIAATWGPEGSQESDRYRVTVVPGYAVDIVSGRTSHVEDVSAEEPCAIVERIRGDQVSAPTRTCITLAEPTSKAFIDLSTGDCIELENDSGTWEGLIEVVDCESRHDTEVFAALDASQTFDTHPGDDAVGTWAEEQCLEAFAVYVGRSYASSTYGNVFWYPDSNNWSSGFRSLICATYNGEDVENRDETRGSAQGSNR